MPELKKLSPEEVRDKVDTHQLWMDTSGEKGELADFSYSDLTKIKFGYVNLEQGDFEGAMLKNATLSPSVFNKANFDKANLERANLKATKLRSANLNEVNLAGANLERVYLEGASLCNADLRRANLNKGSLKGANLSGANLQNASLRFADLEGASLEDAILSDADFYGANLQGVSLGGVGIDGVNLDMVRGTPLGLEPGEIENKYTTLQKDLFKAEQEGEQLKEELSKAVTKLNQVSPGEETTSLKEQISLLESEQRQAERKIKSARSKLEIAEQRAKEFEAQNRELMNSAVSGAAAKMRNSVAAARRAVNSNGRLARFFTVGGAICYLAAILYLIVVLISDSCECALGLIIDGKSVVNSGWQLVPLYLPVAALLTIGTGFFRHEGKIRNQNSLLIEQISQAEKAAGLLEIATDLERIPDEKLERIILPTFIDIRRSLLTMGGSFPVTKEQEEQLSYLQGRGLSDISHISKTGLEFE